MIPQYSQEMYKTHIWGILIPNTEKSKTHIRRIKELPQKIVFSKINETVSQIVQKRKIRHENYRVGY